MSTGQFDSLDSGMTRPARLSAFFRAWVATHTKSRARLSTLNRYMVWIVRMALNAVL